MVKKLTLSIPDDLHKKLAQYRDQLPISSVCASAIRTAISDIEDNVKEARRRFKLITLKEACDLAFKKGISWAGHEASAEELAYVCEHRRFEKSIFEDLYLSNQIIKELSGKSYENYPGNYIIDKGILDDFISPFINEENEDIEVAESFREGARQVWNEIKGELIPKLLNPEEN